MLSLFLFLLRIYESLDHTCAKSIPKSIRKITYYKPVWDKLGTSIRQLKPFSYPHLKTVTSYLADQPRTDVQPFFTGLFTWREDNPSASVTLQEG